MQLLKYLKTFLRSKKRDCDLFQTCDLIQTQKSISIKVQKSFMKLYQFQKPMGINQDQDIERKDC